MCIRDRDIVALQGKQVEYAKEVADYDALKVAFSQSGVPVSYTHLDVYKRQELVEAGKLTPAYPTGKVPRKYFFERCMIEE